MLLIEGREYGCPTGDYALPGLVEDMEFRRCSVDMCQHPARQRDPGDRPVVRGVRFIRCKVAASDLPPVIAEDCVIDTITFHRGIWGAQRIVGSAFRHVVIRGNVTGAVAFTPGPAFMGFRADRDATTDPYVAANRRYYEDVDWALDISEARFTSVEFASGIPSSLIRRDPSTQVVLRRSAVIDGRWEDQVDDPLARIWIEDLLRSGFDDTVLVAAKRGRRFAEVMAVIAKLRAVGLVEE